MTQMSQTDSSMSPSCLNAGGNTKPQHNKSRKYTLTINNPNEKMFDSIKHTCQEKGWGYIIGKEVAKTGTKHLQIYIEHKYQIRFETLKKLWPTAHIEKARGSKNDNLTYCSKEGNYSTNLTRDMTIRERCLEEEYKNVVWKPWQDQILKTITEDPHNRIINWIYEPEGNYGKSFLCKFIALKFENVIIADGKKNDVYNNIFDKIYEHNIEPRIILIDVPRHNLDFINYGAIEQIKNGMLYSGKYHGGICCFRIPHVFIFCNEEPDMEKWSKDRYNIIEISSRTLTSAEQADVET